MKMRLFSGKDRNVGNKSAASDNNKGPLINGKYAFLSIGVWAHCDHLRGRRRAAPALIVVALVVVVVALVLTAAGLVITAVALAVSGRSCSPRSRLFSCSCSQ